MILTNQILNVTAKNLYQLVDDFILDHYGQQVLARQTEIKSMTRRNWSEIRLDDSVIGWVVVRELTPATIRVVIEVNSDDPIPEMVQLRDFIFEMVGYSDPDEKELENDLGADLEIIKEAKRLGVSIARYERFLKIKRYKKIGLTNRQIAERTSKDIRQINYDIRAMKDKGLLDG